MNQFKTELTEIEKGCGDKDNLDKLIISGKDICICGHLREEHSKRKQTFKCKHQTYNNEQQYFENCHCNGFIKKDCDVIELCPKCQARKSQLRKDQEIHEKIMKEFVEKLKDRIIENDIYTADEIFRIICEEMEK